MCDCKKTKRVASLNPRKKFVPQARRNPWPYDEAVQRDLASGRLEFTPLEPVVQTSAPRGKIPGGLKRGTLPFSWPKQQAYPGNYLSTVNMGWRVPNATSVGWPQSQFAPAWLPPGSASFQPFNPQDKAVLLYYGDAGESASADSWRVPALLSGIAVGMWVLSNWSK